MEGSTGSQIRPRIGLRDLIAQLKQPPPGGGLGEALGDATKGIEEALGPLLVAEVGEVGDADPAATERASLAASLLEAADRAQARVHGLGVHDQQDQAPADTRDNRVDGLAGVWLRSRATELAAEIGDAALARQSRALDRMAKGWICEAEDLYDAGRTPERCIEAVEATRGSLCSLAAGLGGIAAGLAQEDVETVASFGARLGTAAQICEDTVALVPALVPSPGRAGQAISRGVYSLPVAYSLEAEPKLAGSLGGAIKDEALDELVSRIRAAGGPARAAAQCRRLTSEAIASIEHLDGGEGLASAATGYAERCEEAALA